MIDRFSPASNYSKYFNDARIKGFGSIEAKTIAQIAGINFPSSYKHADYSKAYEVLELAELARAKGKDISWLQDNMAGFKELISALEHIRRLLG